MYTKETNRYWPFTKICIRMKKKIEEEIFISPYTYCTAHTENCVINQMFTKHLIRFYFWSPAELIRIRYNVQFLIFKMPFRLLGVFAKWCDQHFILWQCFFCLYFGLSNKRPKETHVLLEHLWWITSTYLSATHSMTTGVLILLFSFCFVGFSNGFILYYSPKKTYWNSFWKMCFLFVCRWFYFSLLKLYRMVSSDSNSYNGKRLQKCALLFKVDFVWFIWLRFGAVTFKAKTMSTIRI